jgi:hypothetical protein
VLNIPKREVRSFAAKGAFFFLLALSVVAAQPREVSGISFPEEVSVAGRELRLNGVGVVTKAIFVEVYAVGLYLEKPATDARAAISIDQAKRIVIGMKHNVSRRAFVQAVERAILLNSRSAIPTLRARLDLLEHALPALKKGDVLDFTYMPGVGTRMRCQGKELTIPGKDFADALFSVWLGPKPVNGALKRQLLGVAHK